MMIKQRRASLIMCVSSVFLGLLTLIVEPQGVQAQWTNGTNISNTNAGNVGVGTVSADQKLGVQGMLGVYPQTWVPPTVRGMFLYHGGNGGNIYAYNYAGGTADPIGISASSIGFNTYIGGSPYERMTIANNGNVGIGTTSPGKKLDIKGAEMRFGNYTDDTGLTKTDSVSNTLYISRSSGSSETTGIGPGYSHKAMITTGETSSWIVDTGAMLMLRSLYTTLGNADYPYTRPGGNVEFYYKRPGATASPFTSSTKFYDDTTTLPAYVNFKPELGFILNSTGNVGIGTTTPGQKLSVVGTVESTSGGFKFPDGTVQTTAVSGGGLSSAANVSAGQFGANTGGGNYTFPGVLTLNGGSSSNWAALNIGGTASINAAGNIYSYARICAGNNSGNCDQAGGVVIAGSGTNTYGNVYLTGSGNTYFNGGNVGIGTTAPLQRLQIGSNTPAATTAPDGVSLGATYSSAAGANPKLRLFDNNAGSVYGLGISDNQFDFIVPTGARYVWNVNGVEKMRLDSAGNVTATGSIAAKYQDVAEWVPATHALPAGTVVTLDPTKSNHVEASSQAYDTRVAGVISVQPGIVLGERGENKVLVATTGRVKLKVDASHGPIQVGDLLVTSDIPGLAMKSQPINVGGVEIHRPGTLIGKALEPLAKGRGEILVLLSLQ